MLKSLTVSNFKAFEKPVTIDFSATGNYEFNPEAVKDGIVKTAIMYGKNASGKSSIGLAIFDIVSNLTDNFVNPRDYSIYQNALHFKDTVNFEYHFEFDGTELIYKYQKLNVTTIVREELFIGDKLVIFYDKNDKDTDFIVNLKGSESLRKNLAALQFSALRWVKNNTTLENNKDNKIFLQLFSFVNKMLFFRSLQDRAFTGYKPAPSLNIVEEIVKRNKFADLQRFFKEAGFTDELIHSHHTGREELFIKFNNIILPFEQVCSTGMSSLLLVYYWLEDINNSEQCPSFICIDEFDAFYHFELAYFVVEKLKTSNCQVLLTTHNTSIFTNDLLRPDCYYICSKDKIVNAHNATLKEIRFGHNLEKLYRGGTFGK